jgi:hypothetical protein
MKYAVDKPLFKMGDRSSIFNRRPISILSSFSKVIEKVVYNQLQEHLKKYSILAEELCGFRRDSSTSKAIYKLINEFLRALNSKSLVGDIFLDLEKAFVIGLVILVFVCCTGNHTHLHSMMVWFFYY